MSGLGEALERTGSVPKLMQPRDNLLGAFMVNPVDVIRIRLDHEAIFQQIKPQVEKATRETSRMPASGKPENILDAGRKQDTVLQTAPS